LCAARRTLITAPIRCGISRRARVRHAKYARVRVWCSDDERSNRRAVLCFVILLRFTGDNKSGRAKAQACTEWSRNVRNALYASAISDCAARRKVIPRFRLDAAFRAHISVREERFEGSSSVNRIR
jgi:hypothetical protein